MNTKMTQAAQLLPGVWHLPLPRHEDARGFLLKTQASRMLKPYLGDEVFRESFYTVSHRHVLRGMHFQMPPHDHVKLVHCAAGAALDVLLDIRKGRGYGRFASVMLDSCEPSLLLIPKGVAHGFLSLEDRTVMHYQTTVEHESQSDAGIRWDSFGFQWPQQEPLLSPRDRAHVIFDEFVSPFHESER